MKIAIVGSGGRLGAALTRNYAAAGDAVIGFRHADLDLASDDQLRSALTPLEFDVLINCAAQTNVDLCETQTEEAFRINADAVRTMGEICAKKGRRCIHISTDYVFDGEKPTGYTEEDEARPISVYGASKRAGEVALLEVWDRHLVVRVSWVFGPDRPSFVDGILKRALEGEKVEAIADKTAVPTFTLDAAELLRPFLSQLPEGGLLHLCNAGACSWQEYGQLAIDTAAAAGLPIKGKTVAPLRMADLTAFIAKRPVNTAMATDKLARLSGVKPRPWEDAVREYVNRYAATLRSQPAG